MARSNRARRRSSRNRGWGSPIAYLAALLLIGLMLGPVLYIITGGFRTNSQITANPAGLPNPWVFRNYSDVLSSSTFWRQVGNSTIAAVATTLGIVVLGQLHQLPVRLWLQQFLDRPRQHCRHHRR